MSQKKTTSHCTKPRKSFPPMSPKAVRAMLCFDPYAHPDRLTPQQLHDLTGYPKHTLLTGATMIGR